MRRALLAADFERRHCATHVRLAHFRADLIYRGQCLMGHLFLYRFERRV